MRQHEYGCLSLLSGKILVFELRAKMLLTNQIGGFFKVQYLVKEVGDKVGFLYTDKHQHFL